MLTIELATLREDEIRDNLDAATPEGWTFRAEQSSESRLWEASFIDDLGALQWEIADITLKQVLLHALGWLEIRKVRLGLGTPEGRWAPRKGDITNDRVHERAYRVTSDDGPSDLEPDEISSVYSSSRRRGTK